MIFQKAGLRKYFEEDFIKANKITGLQKKQKLFSRKNDVYKIDVSFEGKGTVTYVLKEYTGEDASARYENECFFYDMLKNSGMRIPGIFYRGEIFLILEFLGDETLLDYIIKMEQSDKVAPVICDSLDHFVEKYRPLADACRYIGDFNSRVRKTTKKSYVLGDMNLRNFLLPGGGIYRVDLEECREGKMAEDYGKFIAFLLTYKPAFTDWKISISGIIKELCKIKFGLARDIIELEINRELELMKNRRKHI